jgi:20S proteasome alpha/beta subunit
MTTIAYKDGVIAFDSRSTRHNTIVDDDCNKCYIRDGVRFFLCGMPAEQEELVGEYFGEESKDDYESHAIVVDGGKLMHFGKTENEGIWKHQLDKSKPYSIGSGEDHAITAMDCGLSAREAVKMAMKRDTGTGGKIRVFKVRQ